MEKLKNKTGYYTLQGKYYYQEEYDVSPVEITEAEYLKATQGLEPGWSYGYGNLLKSVICKN